MASTVLALNLLFNLVSEPLGERARGGHRRLAMMAASPKAQRR